MKEYFFEHYAPSEDEIKSIWKDGIFSFDTNSLLNLYKYSDKTREQFIQVLKDIKGKMILTHQVGYEFHKNRLVRIDVQQSAYDKINEKLTAKFNELSNTLNLYKHHPYLDVSSTLSKIDSLFKEIINNNEELKKAHPNFYNEDPIKNIIGELFDKKITPSYDQTRLDEIFKEGEKRYLNNICPGWKDKENKKSNGNLSLYGDVIIWFQIMDLAKEKTKPIIFVTDDLKEDWWQEFKGKTISPQPELLREFFNTTKQKILIYNTETFLRMANKQINAVIDESSINEIFEIRSRETFKELLNEYVLIDDSISQNEKVELINHINKSVDTYLNPEIYFSTHLSNTEKEYFLNIYKSLDEKRKRLINLRFDLELISEKETLNFLTPDEISIIRNFIKFYKEYGLKSDKVFETYLSNYF